ncbi:hypothetical protein D3C74_48610 [compost metagenome]
MRVKVLSGAAQIRFLTVLFVIVKVSVDLGYPDRIPVSFIFLQRHNGNDKNGSSQYYVGTDMGRLWAYASNTLVCQDYLDGQDSLDDSGLLYII